MLPWLQKGAQRQSVPEWILMMTQLTIGQRVRKLKVVYLIN